MNQEHANNPVEKYKTGDPSTWAEDPDMRKPWDGEGRNEVGLPAPAKEAVMAARKLEDKALKCITIAQRMLPGSADDLIEAQATDPCTCPSVVSSRHFSVSETAQKLAAEVKEDEDELKKEEKDATSEKDEEKDKEKAKDAGYEKDEEKDKAKDKAKDAGERALRKMRRKRKRTRKGRGQDEGRGKGQGEGRGQNEGRGKGRGRGQNEGRGKG